MGGLSRSLLGCSACLVVAAIDSATPLGRSTPILYLIPVSWVSMWSPAQDLWSPLLTAITATVFTAGASYISPVADCASLAFSNRTLAIVVMWSVLLGALTRKTYEQDRLWRRSE
ncbi:hypothetical protein [Candidatus Nitrospira bockiana]